MADEITESVVKERRALVTIAGKLEPLRPGTTAAFGQVLGIGMAIGIADKHAGVVHELAIAHAPYQLYESYDNCPHLEPEDADSGEWADWDGGHPLGEALSGLDAFRICHASPLGAPVCQACSQLVQEATGDDTAEVLISECIVRPVIAACLHVKEVPVDPPH